MARFRIVCDARTGLGGTWNRAGYDRLSIRRQRRFLQSAGGRRSADGPDSCHTTGERFRYRPQFLPDGRRFLYFVEPDAVYLASLDGGEPRRILTRHIVDGTLRAAWVSGLSAGAYDRGPTVRRRSDKSARRFSADCPRRPPRAGLPDCGFDAAIGGALFSVSENGVLAYVKVVTPIPSFSGGSIGLANPSTRSDRSPSRPCYARLSPDNTQIAMQSPAGHSEFRDLALPYSPGPPDAAHVQSTGQTVAPSGHLMVAVWSSRLCEREHPASTSSLPGASSPRNWCFRSGSAVWNEHWPVDWTSKGILLESGMDFESWDLWILPIDGDRKPYPIVQEPGSQYRARLSPDGRWVAYAQMLERTSIPDLYVRSLSTGGKWRISTAGGSFPRWGRNGKELFYLAATAN